MIHQFSINFHLSQDPPEMTAERISPDNAYSRLATIISELNHHNEDYCLVLQVINAPSIGDHLNGLRQLHALTQSLSKREMEVFQLAMKGLSNKVISERLFISVETVRTHRKKIVNKAGVKKIDEIKNWLLVTTYSQTSKSPFGVMRKQQ
jgi:DNA-binding CsgD family transcriptional regulator